jgi:hypothetical protein
MGVGRNTFIQHRAHGAVCTTTLLYQPFSIMAEQSVYHIVPRDGVWAVKRQGAQQASRVANSRDGAMRIAQAFARSQAPVRIVLHREDGTIESQVVLAEPPARNVMEWLTSAPVLGGIALGLVATAVAVAFAYRD